METLGMNSVQFPSLSPLAVNAASSIFGFISLFLCYKALVTRSLVSLTDSNYSVAYADDDMKATPCRIWKNISKPFVKRYQAWAYLFWGPEMIQKAFDEADGKPFELVAPDNRYVFVSDPQQIKELDNAPDTVLSLQAASKQVCSSISNSRNPI
jgi:hypothetical protein